MPSQVFTSSGTFTVPAGVTVLTAIRMISGGQGGTRGSDTYGGTGGTGGNGGNYGEKLNIPVTPLDVLSFEIGQGGTGEVEGGDPQGNGGASYVLDGSSSELINVPGGGDTVSMPNTDAYYSGGYGFPGTYNGTGEEWGGGGGGAGGDGANGENGSSPYLDGGYWMPGAGGNGGGSTYAGGMGGSGGDGYSPGEDGGGAPGYAPGGGGGGGSYAMLMSAPGAPGSAGKAWVSWDTPTPPAAVTSLAKTSTVDISWTAVSGVDGYAVYKNGTLVDGNVASNSFEFASAPSNGDIIHVRSVKNALESSDTFLLWSDGSATVELSALPDYGWELNSNYLPSFGQVPLIYQSGTVAWTTGAIGNALNTGIIKTGSAINFPASGWSISLWGQAKSTSSGTGAILYRVGGSLFSVNCTQDPDPRGIYHSSAAARLEPADQAYNWHHSLLTYDGTTLRLYTNGVLSEQATASADFSFNLQISFGGKACIDQTAIWLSDVLTADDAAALYAAGSGAEMWKWALAGGGGGGGGAADQTDELIATMIL